MQPPGGIHAPVEIHGDAMTAIVNALVREHKEFFGRGPNQARGFVSGNTLVCVLEGVLSRPEQRLIERGDADAVLAQRSAVQRAMRDTVAAVIEVGLDRHVRSFMSANDVDEDLMIEVFVLDRPLPDPARTPAHDPDEVIHEHRQRLDDMRALREEQVQSREALRRTAERLGQPRR